MSDLLECAICQQLLLQPVTTVCGHTFCRGCLTRALDYRQQCPSCRGPVSASLGLNVLLASLIESRFPDELLRRQQDELIHYPSPPSSTLRTSSSNAPAFVPEFYPLLTSSDKRTALLPHLLVSLPIQGSSSAQAALDFARQSRQVVVFPASRTGEGAVGVLCDLLHVGEARAVLKAKTRVVLLEIPHIRRFSVNHPQIQPQPQQLLQEQQGDQEGEEERERQEDVIIGRVSEIRDHEEDETLMNTMVGEILELLHRQLSLIGRAGRTIFEDEFGQVPRTVSGDFEKFSFWVSACLDTRGNWPLLLTTRSTLERLRLVRGLMRNAGAHVVLTIATDRSWLRLRSGLAGVLGLLVLLLALWWRSRMTEPAELQFHRPRF